MDRLLTHLLDQEQIAVHPFVLGELALGNLRNTEQVLANVETLPFVTAATAQEVLQLVRQQRLSGSGIGYVDAHLLAAARLTPGLELWTHDRRLHAAALRLGLVFQP